MRIDIITVSPELIKSPFGHPIIKRSLDKKVGKYYNSSKNHYF